MTENTRTMSEPLTLGDLERTVASIPPPPIIYHHPDDEIRLRMALERLWEQACRSLPASESAPVGIVVGIGDLATFRSSKILLTGLAWLVYDGKGIIIDFRNDAERQRDEDSRNASSV